MCTHVVRKPKSWTKTKTDQTWLHHFGLKFDQICKKSALILKDGVTKIRFVFKLVML